MKHKDFSKASMKELLEFIERHHCEIKEKLRNLPTLIARAAELKLDQFTVTLDSLQEFYPVFNTSMEGHFAREEDILFPYIRQMDQAISNAAAKPEFHVSSIKNPISQLEYDHDQTENVMFDKLRTITGNYQLPQSVNSAFKILYDSLKDIETNISEHIKLEKNILFPWAIELELRLIHKR